jgi:hypothetical protein
MMAVDLLQRRKAAPVSDRVWEQIDDALHLFCVESVAAQLLTPDAVCVLAPA